MASAKIQPTNLSPPLLRQNAEQQMGRPIPDTTWEVLENFGSVQDVLDGRRDLNWLTDRAWDLLGQHGRTPAPPMAQPASDDAYRRVVSELVALDAASDEKVQAFRRDVLSDRLLPVANVAAWIQQQRTADGPATQYLTIPLAVPVRLESTPRAELVAQPPIVIDAAHPLKPPYKTSLELLAYLIADSPWVHHVPVAHSGVLGRLHRLSERLAQSTGWWPAAATDFVLTGRTPIVSAIIAGVESKGRGRLTLSVDPIVTPRRLSAAYQSLRRQVFADRRLRTLTAKHLELALFLARHPDGSWDERRRIWNKEHPAEKYSDTNTARFRRDAVDASRRLDAAKISMFSALHWIAEPTHEGKPKGTRRRVTRRR